VFASEYAERYLHESRIRRRKSFLMTNGSKGMSDSERKKNEMSNADKPVLDNRLAPTVIAP
jgi:hypothetical protein